VQESDFNVDVIDGHDNLCHMSLTDKKTKAVVYGSGKLYYNVYNKLEKQLKEKIKKLEETNGD